MLRKLTLGLAAATALTFAALAPTTASAHGWHHHHGWHGGYGFGYGLGVGPVYVGGPAYDDCLRRQRIMTRHGYRWRTVNVCY